MASFFAFFCDESDMSSISIPSDRERDPFHGASGALLGHWKGGERLGPGGGQRKPPSAAGRSSRLENGVPNNKNGESVGFYCWNMVNQLVNQIAYFQTSFPKNLSLFVMGNAAKHWALLVDFPENLVNQGNRSLNHLLKNTWSQYRNRVLKMVPVGELDIIKPYQTTIQLPKMHRNSLQNPELYLSSGDIYKCGIPPPAHFVKTIFEVSGLDNMLCP